MHMWTRVRRSGWSRAVCLALLSCFMVSMVPRVALGARPIPDNGGDSGISTTGFPPIRLWVNGSEVNMPPDLVYVKNGRTMLPVAIVAQALGGRVLQWDASAETAYLTNPEGTSVLRIIIGQSIMWLDNAPMHLEVPAEIHMGRTMVPIRAVAEAFGATITTEWTATKRNIQIRYSPNPGFDGPTAQCSRHGLDDANCTQGSFLLAQAIHMYGPDHIANWMRYGMFTGENGKRAVAYMNRVAATRNGEPVPRSVLDILDQHGVDIAIDASLAAALAAQAGVALLLEMPYVVEQAGAESEQARESFAEQVESKIATAARPTSTGWGRPTQFMKVENAFYQVKQSGKGFTMLDLERVAIDEYGIVTQDGAYWFDGYDEATNTILEMKSASYEYFLDDNGPFGFKRFWVNSGRALEELETFRHRIGFTQSAGYGYEVRFQSEAYMNTLIRYALEHGFADVVEHFKFAP